MSSSRRKKRIQEESSSEEDALFNSDDDDSSDEKAHEEGSLTFSASRMKDAMSKLKTCLDPEPAANEQATSWSDVETKCYKLKDCGAAFEVAKESEKQPPEFMCLLVEASRQLLLEKNKDSAKKLFKKYGGIHLVHVLTKSWVEHNLTKLVKSTETAKSLEMNALYLKLVMRLIEDCFIIETKGQLEKMKSKQNLDWIQCCQDVLEASKAKDASELTSAASAALHHLETLPIKVEKSSETEPTPVPAKPEPSASIGVDLDAIKQKGRKDRLAAMKARARSTAGVVSKATAQPTPTQPTPAISIPRRNSAPSTDQATTSRTESSALTEKEPPQDARPSNQRNLLEIKEEDIDGITPSYFAEMLGEPEVPTSWEPSKRPPDRSAPMRQPRPPAAKVISAGRSERFSRERPNAPGGTSIYSAASDNQQRPYEYGGRRDMASSGASNNEYGRQPYPPPSGNGDFKRKREYYDPRGHQSYQESSRSAPPSDYERQSEPKRYRSDYGGGSQGYDQTGSGRDSGRSQRAGMPSQDGPSAPHQGYSSNSHQQRQAGGGRGRGNVSNLPAWMTQQESPARSGSAHHDHAGHGNQAPSHGQGRGRGRGNVSNLPAWMTQQQSDGPSRMPTPPQQAPQSQAAHPGGRGRGRGNVSNLPAWMTKQG